MRRWMGAGPPSLALPSHHHPDGPPFRSAAGAHGGQSEGLLSTLCMSSRRGPERVIGETWAERPVEVVGGAGPGPVTTVCLSVTD